jgi:signal transduction histidine kinase
VALCLYRVAQESLGNAGKHAGGSTVHVTLRGTSVELTLMVADRGVGFDRELTKGKRGLGLVSMEERVRIVSGTLSVTSSPGDGTRVVASVPLDRISR